MTHTSPTVELVWAVLSVTLLIFLLCHLYHFDRFKCLKLWDSQNRGAFKKLMTYAYLTSIPLMMFRSVVFATIKYEEGYIAFPGHGFIPKPYIFWPQSSQRWIFPAQLCFAIAWSLEMVSHLEELCFWMFLTTVAPLQRGWFNSYHFYTWAIGSVIAVVTMPVVATLTREKAMQSEAYIFLAGSIGSTIITVAFFRVLWYFPTFLKRVKTEGAGQEVVTRLQAFHALNVIRVAFRTLFVVCLLILAIDGVRPHHHINESPLWTDLLAVLAAIGVIVSSTITLLIFFPRSSTREAGYSSRIRSVPEQDKSFFTSSQPIIGADHNNPFAFPDSPANEYDSPITPSHLEQGKPSMWELEEVHRAEPVRIPVQFRLANPNAKRKKRPATVHPMVMNFRSPIQISDY